MTTQSNDQTEQAQSDMKLGVLSVSTGIAHLWEKNAHRLSVQELEWFVNFTDQAETETNNLAKMILNLACLIGADEHTGSFQNSRPLSDLLFNLSHQIDTINGMIHIGSRAEDRLRRPELYKKLDGAI